ncbi:MAG: putative toxin-antitoxin system toxin component, PIN family [Firmicutes bacterium]|nr:putative toxin-antitoxin system toxin component, PIN family [Bacillota bacterium]
MRCLIDTNILVSASLFPTSVPAQAYFKAVTAPNTGMVCDYSVDEMRRVYNKKFPHKIHMMEKFLSMMLLSAKIVHTPPEEESLDDEAAISDIKDRPILRAAVKSNAEVLISGDRHFLDSGLKHPKIMSPSDFLKL